jgi:hypothetical protein
MSLKYGGSVFFPSEHSDWAMRFGKPDTAYGSGLNIGQGYQEDGAPVGFYFDDKAGALTQWGEGFTVGNVVTRNTTGAAQTGWPYTAFFYNDVEADVTSSSNSHWPTLMTNFSIGTGKGMNGFGPELGCSSHHASVDCNGKLASKQNLAAISFGGNWPGTIDGTVVPMHIRPTNQNWTALMKISGNSGCYSDTSNGSGGGGYKWLKYLIDSTVYKVMAQC